MTEDIFALASLLTHPEEEQQELLRLLCAAAEEETKRKLTVPEDTPGCAEALLCAAAWLAAADFMGCQGAAQAGEFQSFTVGEVSIARKESQEVTGSSAQQLRSQAARILAPYCGGDGAFAFLGVPG